MKYLKINSLLLLTLLLFNCSESDDSSSNLVSIVGTWRLVQEVDHIDGEPDEVYTVQVGCNEELLIFTDNSLTSESDYDCDAVVDETYSAGYSINGNILTIEGESALIQELTESTLIFRYDIIGNNEEYTDAFFERLN